MTVSDVHRAQVCATEMPGANRMIMRWLVAIANHRLPDGVRTNGFFIDVPEIPIIIPYVCHNYVIIMIYCGTSAKKTFVMTPSGSR